MTTVTNYTYRNKLPSPKQGFLLSVQSSSSVEYFP